MQHPGFGAVLRHAWERSRGSISLGIVGVCIVVFVGVAFLDRLGIVTRQNAVSFLGLSYVGVFQRVWIHQFLTAPLVHGGVAHLLFNMLSLWMLGPGVETAIGRRRYIFFSILCAVSSMAGFLVFNWGTGHIAIGYSGIIFGILVAQAMYFPNNVIAIFAFFPLKMKYAVLLLGTIELYLTLSPEGGGIAHAAHLFGALAAFIYLRMLRRQESSRNANAVSGTRFRARSRDNRKIKRKRTEVPREL